MEEKFLTEVTSIVAIGILAQWLAWRLRLPAILLFLVAGFLAGPILGILNPDQVFGELIAPVVSLAVAIILFEGGLSLKITDLSQIGGVVRNLVSLGALITWIVTAILSYVILDLNLSISLVLGAVVVVSGPTVIIPLLRQVRLKGRVGLVLRWEGIIIDPIGVTLAVLVFEAILVGEVGQVTLMAASGVLKTALVGCIGGVGAALFFVLLLRNYLVPDYLHSPIALAIVVGAFTLSNLIQIESGLLTATILGIVIANQRLVSITHIIEFKENLRVLLISGLFVLLSARVRLEDLDFLGVESLVFLGLLIFVVRPLVVLVCSIRSDLTWREKVLLSFVAPRGIVAASIGSIFAIQLTALNYPQAEQLLPYVFFVIFGTVLIYGLGAPVLARILGLSEPEPRGALIVGSHRWARALATALQQEGCKVVLVDTNIRNVNTARREGLQAYHGDINLDHHLEEVVLEGVGRLIALTPNDEVNTLAALHFADIFGSREVYQVKPAGLDGPSRTSGIRSLRSRILFGKDWSFRDIDDQIRRGAEIETIELDDGENSFDELKRRHGKRMLPLFLIEKDGGFLVYTRRAGLVPVPGERLICMMLAE